MSRPSMSQSYGERQEMLQNLMEEVLAIQRDGERTEETMARIREIAICSGDLIRDAEDAHDMVIDAHLLAASSHLVRAHVSSHNTNLTSFVPEDYTSGLLGFVEGNSVHTRYNWDVLAAETCCMFKKVPPLSYMLGTFVMNPPPPQEKEKRARQQKLVDGKKMSVQAVEEVDHEGESSDEIYQHILKCLIERYRKKGKQPIEYLEFITDPEDYWRTVENIFHFAFLVRDDKVKMTLNDRKLPVVVPFLKEENNGEQQRKVSKNRQFNFRISIHEWRQIIKVYKIEKACIRPFRSGK